MSKKTKSGKPAPKRKIQRRTEPWMIITIILVAVAALGTAALVLMNNPIADSKVDTLPSTVSVQDAYDLYQGGAFVLDVRTQEEWDEYHAPNTTLIPLDQLESRLSELPKDQPIVVVCRSGNRSDAARDILLNAGFNATSMDSGLNAWRSAGYPIE